MQFMRKGDDASFKYEELAEAEDSSTALEIVNNIELQAALQKSENKLVNMEYATIMYMINRRSRYTFGIQVFR
jgi:hypothetical protein